MATFTVDTHLFRELGELLVGRDSTALVELIKNAYDADAVRVVVYGEFLEDQGKGLIRIRDDGIGMNREQFEAGFLRVASRARETTSRRSIRYGRRYTGEKGVGRLAAHKLSRKLGIYSVPGRTRPGQTRNAVDATIDWDLVEAQETLDQLADTAAIVLKEERVSADQQSGTTITLARLRRAWSRREHARFLEEVQTFSPPEVLTRPLPRGVLETPLLFEVPKVRDVEGSGDPGFKVELEGDLAPPEDYWQAAAAATDWVVEIEATEGSNVVSYGIAPAARVAKQLDLHEKRVFEVPHPSPEHGPFFSARLLLRTGQKSGSKHQRMWATRNAGIRVFMEGFRVLPYGESGNDWLGLDRDYVERKRGVLRNLPHMMAGPAEDLEEEDAGLVHLPQRSYFGAVFLTHSGAESLQMLVNREGFVPEGAYEHLVNLVRDGIDIATRVRAAATRPSRAARQKQRKSPSLAGTSEPNEPTSKVLERALAEARQLASEAQTLTAAGDYSQASAKLDAAVKRVAQFSDTSEDLARESAMLRVLASVGTQLAGFIHEINALLASAEAIERALDKLRHRAADNRILKQALAQLHRAAGDLRRQLERQASYLVDIVSPDARRRRSRQYISRRFDTATRLIGHVAERRGIRILNRIPADLQSPPMFPAELTAVFTNLLSNAVKAAGQGGQIRADAQEASGNVVRVRVANTGTPVTPEEGERWFRPFESSTTAVDPVLGQGMGLGLPITRTILEEYGAEIGFVAPPQGFSTALEIRFSEE